MKGENLLKSHDKRAEAIRFVFVGGFATVLQYGMYVVFVYS